MLFKKTNFQKRDLGAPTPAPALFAMLLFTARRHQSKVRARYSTITIEIKPTTFKCHVPTTFSGRKVTIWFLGVAAHVKKVPDIESYHWPHLI